MISGDPGIDQESEAAKADQGIGQAFIVPRRQPDKTQKNGNRKRQALVQAQDAGRQSADELRG